MFFHKGLSKASMVAFHDSMNVLNYNITLSTRETLDISEFDPELISLLKEEAVLSVLSSLLRLCTYVSRDEVERAKRGETKPLERALRTPPYGCLVKIDTPICAEIKTCIMADIKKCTSKNIVKYKGKFPPCWTYRTNTDGETRVQAHLLATAIVDAWKEGRYVLIIR